jgi:hypothetical protein
MSFVTIQVPPTTDAPSTSIRVKRQLVEEVVNENQTKHTEHVQSTPQNTTEHIKAKTDTSIPASMYHSLDLSVITIWLHRKEHHIYVGAYYDPHLLPDYGGNLFWHHEAKLIQHDVQDTDLHLIPPWEYYDKLCAV